MPAKTVGKKISEMEFELAKHKAVLAAFPDAKVNAWGGFTARSVNKTYTGFKFEHCKGYALYVLPHYTLEFEHNGISGTVQIGSAPRKNKLAYIEWNYKDKPIKRIMKFARMSINMKAHEFKEDMLNSCRSEIMKFIQDHPGCSIDKKYLEPRLNKLLLFT